MNLYRLLLRLYPRDFRDRFEAEMVALFADNAAGAPPTLRGRVMFWRDTLVDLLRSAARERLPERRSLSMSQFASDVRQAWRTVARAPFVSALAILLMALSVGSTTAVFSIVHTVLLRPFPFADPDRLVIVWERQSPENQRNVVGAHEFPLWAERSRSFASMAAITFDREYNLTGAGEPLKLTSVRVTSDFFKVMGVAPEAGRVFTADEDRPGHGDVVIVSDRLWRASFAADPSIVGRSIALNGTPHVVVGVMPGAFQFPTAPAGGAPDIWTPIAEPIQRYAGRHYLWVIARLSDGVTLAQARGEMDSIASAIERELPQFSRGHGVNIQPLQDELVYSVRPALLLLFAAVTLVLLIGCCNVASLLLARAAGRQQEIAVRIALGAGRWRIARQLLAEGSLLAAGGGAGGVLLASWLTAVARAAASGDVPRLQNAQVDGIALAFAAAVGVLTALLFGLVPLAQVARVQVADRLKHGSKGTARPLRQPLRRTLVVAEITLTMVVATAAGLLLQSFQHLLRQERGFRTDGVVAFDLALPSTRYAQGVAARTFVDELIARTAALPGVTGVAATSMVPQGAGRSGIAISIEGRPAPLPGDSPSAAYRIVSDQYFAALGIPLISGRAFSERDARAAVPLIRWFPQQRLPARFDEPQAPPAAIVNESMARRFWPGEDPVGRRFTVLFSPPITIIGVVRDSRDQSPWDDTGPEFFLSHRQEPTNKMTLMVRSSTPADAMSQTLRSTVWSIDRDLPVANVSSLEAVVDANVSLYRTIVLLISGFAAIAVFLMALGVYAVVSYTTAQRTYEIGVRLALGARRADIGRLVILSNVGLAAIAIVAGSAGAYAIARYATSLLYEVAPADPRTYAALATLVLAIVACAAWAPARRAQRVDPLTVLRTE